MKHLHLIEIPECCKAYVICGFGTDSGYFLLGHRIPRRRLSLDEYKEDIREAQDYLLKRGHVLLMAITRDYDQTVAAQALENCGFVLVRRVAKRYFRNPQENGLKITRYLNIWHYYFNHPEYDENGDLIEND